MEAKKSHRTREEVLSEAREIDIDVLKLHKAGVKIAEIAKRFGVSKERIRIRIERERTRLLTESIR